MLSARTVTCTAPAGAALCLALACLAAAGETRAVVRAETPIILDGRIDDEAWQSAAPLPLVVYEPTYGGSPSQRTEVRVIHDERSLYVGAVLFDSEPAAVRAGTLYRDRYSGDDTVGVIVDGFNDDRNAYWFYTTPAGVRGDAAVSDDMASGQGDFSWNGQWEARAVQMDGGWSAEMRIPFTTLGFQPKDGRVTIGLGVYRWLARHNERQVWPDVPPRWARAYAKPSKLTDVTLDGVRGGRGLILSPYALGGTVDRTGGAETRREAGVDLRRGVGAGLTLDLSLNTDFAQVEADDTQVNLTRFPLFFPEKRPFFLERADVFDFGWEGTSRLFHSRRIGLRNGEPVRLWGGARLAGRAGDWDIGILDVQAAGRADRPAENFGVLRLRRRSPRVVVGGIITTRASTDGSLNAVAGTDLDWRVRGDEFLTFKAARSSTRGQAEGDRVFLQWQRRRRQGLSYEATLSRSSRGFEAGLGFDSRRDFAYGAGRITYEWLLGSQGPLRRITADLSTEAYRRNGDRRVESATTTPSVVLETRRGDALTAFATHRREDVAEPFELPSGLSVPAARYRFDEAGLSIGTSGGRRLRPAVSLRTGSFYDGRRWTMAPAVSWYASRHLELAAEYERNALRFSTRGGVADADLLRVRVQAAWDIHASLSLLAQYDDLSRDWSLNTRARYHVREGTDFWLVYDDRRAAGGVRHGRSRSLLAKVTYTVVR